MRQQIISSVKMSPALRECVQNLADARRQSAHAVMLQAIESYVEREEKREALRQEAKAAHDTFMQTDLHLTNQKVREWLDQLRQGNKVPMPKCHIELFGLRMRPLTFLADKDETVGIKALEAIAGAALLLE